ncbi:MAG: zinc-ribbon domain-containing protein [Clostridia bacterium]|nr:zinc-ribbon domain-containing protein [Clostridia bacterium]
MKICKSCGAQMNDQATYCPRCGAPASAAAPQQGYQNAYPGQPQPQARPQAPAAYQNYQRPAAQPAYTPVYTPQPAPMQYAAPAAAPSPLAQPAANAKVPALTLFALFVAFVNLAMQFFVPHMSKDYTEGFSSVFGGSCYSYLRLFAVYIKEGGISWSDADSMGILLFIAYICVYVGLALTAISAIIMFLPYATKSKASMIHFVPMIISTIISLAAHVLFFVAMIDDAVGGFEFGDWIGLFIYFAVALIAIVCFIVVGVVASKEKNAAPRYA